MKITLSLILVILMVFSANSADLNRNVQFVDGQRLTAAQLMALIDTASISTAFISSKPLESTLNQADAFVVFSPSFNAYRQINASSMLYNNTALITSQSEKAVPVGGDYILLWDSVANMMAKVNVANIVSTATNSISALRALDIAFGPTFTLATFSGLTNYQVTIAQIYSNTPPTAVLFTNLLQPPRVTNQDGFLYYSSLSGTNQFMPVSSLITNSFDDSGLTNDTDYFWGFSSNLNAVVKYSRAEVIKDVVGSKFVRTFGTMNAVGWSGGQVVVTNTGFNDVASTVRWVIKCNTAEFGYNVGDEIDVHDVVSSSTDRNQQFLEGSSTNNVWLVGYTFTNPFFPTRTNGNVASITLTRWNYKVYATH